MEETKPQLFAVLAEIKDYASPLYLIDLTFARLIDDVVLPYQTDQAFFIDGVPLKREKLVRLKILKQSETFGRTFRDLHWRMRETSSVEGKKLLGDQYDTRLAAVFRECGEDVTSQVIKAYDTSIKPRLKDYIPKREELISTALTLFIESVKILNKSA
jgi:hypothetical protein